MWPWLAQIGQGRGGFYSYELLENVIGRAEIHNADGIHPEWQRLQVGDEVRLHPEVALAVVDLRPGSALVVRGAVPMGDVDPPYDFTWAFCLRQLPDGSSRLLIRERYTDTRPWAHPLVEVVSMVSFVMTQRMLRGIRDRAESGGEMCSSSGPNALPACSGSNQEWTQTPGAAGSRRREQR